MNLIHVKKHCNTDETIIGVGLLKYPKDGFTSFKNYVVFNKNIPYEDDVLDLYKNGYTISDNGNVKLHVKDREHYKVF